MSAGQILALVWAVPMLVMWWLLWYFPTKPTVAGEIVRGWARGESDTKGYIFISAIPVLSSVILLVLLKELVWKGVLGWASNLRITHALKEVLKRREHAIAMAESQYDYKRRLAREQMGGQQ